MTKEELMDMKENGELHQDIDEKTADLIESVASALAKSNLSIDCECNRIIKTYKGQRFTCDNMEHVVPDMPINDIRYLLDELYDINDLSIFKDDRRLVKLKLKDGCMDEFRTSDFKDEYTPPTPVYVHANGKSYLVRICAHTIGGSLYVPWDIFSKYKAIYDPARDKPMVVKYNWDIYSISSVSDKKNYYTHLDGDAWILYNPIIDLDLNIRGLIL